MKSFTSAILACILFTTRLNLPVPVAYATGNSSTNDNTSLPAHHEEAKEPSLKSNPRLLQNLHMFSLPLQNRSLKDFR